MKKILSLGLIICGLLLTACNDISVGVIGGADGPTDIIVSDNKPQKTKFGEQIEKKSIRMFNVDGELYYDLGIKSENDARCGTFDGIVEKTVDENEIPKVAGTANFEADGYQNVTDAEKEVCVDGEWLVFKKYDNQPEDMDEYTYCFYMKGHLNNASKDSEIVVLTDDEEVTFDDCFVPLLSSEKPIDNDVKTSFNGLN